jgi:predicted N-acetyltransferase YhbS
MESGDPLRVECRAASLSEIFALRRAMLVAHLPRRAAEFEGDQAEETLHFGAFNAGGECVGCATFMPAAWQSGAAHQLRGMATRSDLARRGIGAALLRCAEESLQSRGVELIWCNARVGAIDFYRKQGWTIASEPFDIPDICVHYKMIKRLAAADSPGADRFSV